MSNEVDVPEATSGGQPSRPPTMLQVVNGVLIALGALYLTTESLAVVLVGAAVVIVVVALYVVTRRP